MSYIIYILHNTTCNKTYVGITNNPIKRLRQHNCELVGGAKYTTQNKGDGVWEYYGHITQKENSDIILDKITALKMEYRIKYLSKKAKGTPIERRNIAVQQTLELYNNDYKFNKL
jgi:putative endonuclease